MNVAQVQFQAGLTALSQNRVPQALSAFQSAAKLAPRAAPAHHMIGVSLQRLGRLAEAEKAISRAIELDPREPDFFSNRALVKCGQERFDRAIFDAKAALRLDPAHVGGLCNLGLAQIGAKQYAAAAAMFTRLIEVAPGFASAYDNASLAVRNIEDPDLAIAAATAFVAAAPDSSIAHVDLSGLLAGRGEVVRAAAELARALQLDPTSFKAHSRRLFNLNYLEAPTEADRASLVDEFT
ncbi:MAG: tetratricopeptide repeat protein, partial [Caulobacteraceae bacterium]